MKKSSQSDAWRRVLTWIPRNANAWVVKHEGALGAWASTVTLIGIPLLFFGAVLTYFQLADYLVRPDVQLFVQLPSDPMFSLVNPTTVLLREPKYQITLFDLDAPTPNGARNLDIPIQELEWILPKGVSGPWRIFSLSPIAQSVPTGHVVFGWAALQCPNCQRPRHYWILIKRGETAWYAEIRPDDWPSITKNLGAIITAGVNYRALVEQLVPVETRIRAAQTR